MLDDCEELEAGEFEDDNNDGLFEDCELLDDGDVEDTDPIFG